MLKRTLISSLMGVMAFFSVYAHQVPNQSSTHQRSSFVVVGAFNLHYNAKRYTEYIRSQEMNAKYAFNKNRQLYYVYTLISEEDKEAIDLVWKLRENVIFNDAWVFRGRLVGDQEVPELVRIDLPNSLKSNDTLSSAPDNNLSDTAHKSVSESSKMEVTTTKKSNSSTEVVNSEHVASPPVGKEAVIEEPIIKGDYRLYVNTINIKKFKEVRGSIEIRDAKRDKKIKIISSHKLIGVNDPKNGSHTIKVVSRIFGYRPKEYIINLDDPVSDSTSAYVETLGDSIIVNFDLERLRKGEIAVMWNVYFFKDAAIMRPESKSEINNLLDMLKENENLRIKIHGHTNGKSQGKLLHLNLNDKNFFSLSGDHVEDMGSAKKLSEYRGYTIQHYLMEQGIDESRMQVVGWGGKKMLFDKHGPQARKNVRVEIEILEI